MKLKFETWLCKQKNRDDPIGDLANDYISDKKNRKPYILSVDYLLKKGACTDAIKAYHTARKEWEKAKDKD